MRIEAFPWCVPACAWCECVSLCVCVYTQSLSNDCTFIPQKQAKDSHVIFLNPAWSSQSRPVHLTIKARRCSYRREPLIMIWTISSTHNSCIHSFIPSQFFQGPLWVVWMRRSKSYTPAGSLKDRCRDQVARLEIRDCTIHPGSRDCS